MDAFRTNFFSSCCSIQSCPSFPFIIRCKKKQTRIFIRYNTFTAYFFPFFWWFFPSKKYSLKRRTTNASKKLIARFLRKTNVPTKVEYVPKWNDQGENSELQDFERLQRPPKILKDFKRLQRPHKILKDFKRLRGFQ